jgi:hypothetical protein
MTSLAPIPSFRSAVLVAFGAYGQVVMGALLVVLTTTETVYWTLVTPPTVRTVFLVSMEALYFAAYAIIATGLAVIWLDKRTPDVDG